MWSNVKIVLQSHVSLLPLVTMALGTMTCMVISIGIPWTLLCKVQSKLI